jgi:NAD(P)H-hydrate epimerase
MQFILTPEEIRQSDENAINKYKIPGEILMENAARSAVEFTTELINKHGLTNPDILILCGSGNNGGDGFAAARHLSRNYSVRVAWIGSESKMSYETKRNYTILTKMQIPITKFETEYDIKLFDFSADVILDALIGVGGNENLRGLVVNILQIVNKKKSLKIAIDVPTGLNSLTGFMHPDTFTADMTITMFAIKTGMLLNDGLSICGDVKVAYLGAPDKIVSNNSKIAFLEDKDVLSLLPSRAKISSKFDYGRVTIIAGSKNMPGAATLAANAAIKMGAGLVYLMAPKFHPMLLPEIIPIELPSDKDGFIDYSSKEQILEIASKSNVLAIGPGLGKSQNVIKLISELIEELPEELPLVLDADAFKALNPTKSLRKNILLTPHLGEFANLTGLNREEISKYVNRYALEWAEKLNCTILLKHVPSIITDGEFSYWNIGGNPGMATAGSGDVLTGIISSLIAQGLNTIEAASLASFLHSKAGDSIAHRFSEETLTSSMLINELDLILHNLKSQK